MRPETLRSSQMKNTAERATKPTSTDPTMTAMTAAAGPGPRCSERKSVTCVAFHRETIDRGVQCCDYSIHAWNAWQAAALHPSPPLRGREVGGQIERQEEMRLGAIVR